MNRRTLVQSVAKFVVAVGILGSLLTAGGAPLDFANRVLPSVQPK
jgi:hypothetical protein